METSEPTELAFDGFVATRVVGSCRPSGFEKALLVDINSIFHATYRVRFKSNDARLGNLRRGAFRMFTRAFHLI